MAVLLIFAMVALSCSGQGTPAARQPDLQWQSLNHGLMPHAPVAAIAFDPNRSQQMAVALYHPLGLYASADDGKSWRVDQELGQPLHALIYDRQQPGVLWAGSADGLYRGHQVAEQWTWQRVQQWPLARAVFAIAQSADGVRYAGGQAPRDVSPAVWYSRYGKSWQPLVPLPVPANSAVLSLAVAGERLLAGTDGFGLFLSENGGHTWAQASEIGETFVAALWVAPWDSDLLLARTRKGLFRSVDGAASWHPVGEALKGRPDVIATTPDGIIYLGMGTGDVLRSEDDGASWQSWGSVGRDGLFYTLAVDPEEPSRLYAGTHYGLYRSRDHGRTWSQVEGIGAFRAVTLAQDARGMLYMGNDDGVYRLQDGDDQWQYMGQGLPQRTVQALRVAPADPSLLFAGTDAGVYRSLDGGALWELIGWPGRGVHGLALDPDDPNRLYIRMAFERIYSTDQSLASEPAWTARWEGMPRSSEILSMAVDPGDPNRLYAGGAVDFFASDDRAESWRVIASDLRGQTVFIVAVDPAQHGRVYAGATNGLYLSEDRGITWSQLGLQDITVTALAWQEAQPDSLYAGTKHRGIWRSSDGGHTWQAAGVPGTTIHALLISPDGRWLYTGTESGVWRADLS